MRYLTTDDGKRYTVEHTRFADDGDGGGRGLHLDVYSLKVAGMPVSPKGGTTTVKILDDKDNVIATGTCTCHPTKDNFNSKLGHRIALGRALAELTGEAQRRRNRDGLYVTASGRVLTEADIDALADEAEAGYDPADFVRRDVH